MALPLPLLPERYLAPYLPPAVERRLTEWRPRLDSLVHAYRTVQQREGNPEERRIVSECYLVNIEIGALLVDHMDALDKATDAVLRELMQQELATAEFERKFALRQLEQAIGMHGEAAELVSGFLDEPLFSALQEATGKTETSEDGDIAIPDELLAIMRWQLDLVVALECLDEPTAVLCHWAQRAVSGARRYAALFAHMAQEMKTRAMLARLEARISWLEWSESDLDEELAPWPQPARSP